MEVWVRNTHWAAEQMGIPLALLMGLVPILLSRVLHPRPGGGGYSYITSRFWTLATSNGKRHTTWKK